MNKGRDPTLAEALVTLFIMAFIIVTCLRLQSGIESVFFPLTLAVSVAVALGIYLRQPWKDIQEGIFSGVSKISIAVLILLLIGALVGEWILSGTIPSLIYYGLEIISPAFFLPTTFLVCLVTSLVTGTSFGTIGTVGIALIGVQAGFGYSAHITAGAIISGAYFGDKMSPLSDTTNIAAAVGQADLFSHIRSMMYTTIPAAVITFFLFMFFGGSGESAGALNFDAMMKGLNAGWNISLIHFIPVLVMLLVAAKKVPSLVSIFISVIIGAVWALIFQDIEFTQVFTAATFGFTSETGVSAIDSVLSHGGIVSMEAIIILVILAGALGGVLNAIGILKVVVESLLNNVKRTGSLIVSVLISCYTVILFTGNQALAIILVGQMYQPAFKKRRIDATVLTRSLEDSGTLSAPLVPWGAAGGFCSEMLGVNTLDYLPYVWFVFLVPVFSVIFGYTGFAVWQEKE